MEGNLTKTLEKYLPYVGKKHKRAYIYPCTLIGKNALYAPLVFYSTLLNVDIKLKENCCIRLSHFDQTVKQVFYIGVPVGIKGVTRFMIIGISFSI